MVEKIKITRIQRKILNALAEGDMRPVELKEELNLADSTLYIALNKLLDAGLVEKKISERKYAVYGLTEKGKEYVRIPKQLSLQYSPNAGGTQIQAKIAREHKELEKLEKAESDLEEIIVSRAIRNNWEQIQKDFKEIGLEGVLKKFGELVINTYENLLKVAIFGTYNEYEREILYRYLIKNKVKELVNLYTYVYNYHK